MSKNFLRIECSECGNEQVIFSHASRKVECLVCGEEVARPRGGSAEIVADLREELNPE